MMRLLAPLMLVAALAAGCASPAGDGPGGDPRLAMLTPYLTVQAALAGDTLDGVPAAAAAIADAAGTLGPGAAAVATGAKAVGAAPDLAAARTAFGELSDAVLAYTKEEGLEPEGLRIAYCPMVNKSWYQKEDQIRNPFYGSEMLECGTFRK
ncbi:MAG: hypothetical protein AB7H88_05010 [Vicinamibacterales bacterium]